TSRHNLSSLAPAKQSGRAEGRPQVPQPNPVPADKAHIQSARNMLALARQRTDAIGCAVSFGKDSLATLDLCCEQFARVEGFYLFRVANLRIVEEWKAAVKKRWGVSVRAYPHFALRRSYRYAVLQPPFRGHEKTPR